MKIITTLILTSLSYMYAYSQQKDTLKNHADGLTLVAYKYTEPGNWGYYLGHNNNYRQQFAEKYSISGSAKILGVISHHAGTYAHPNNKAEFNIFEVGSNHYPSNALGSKEVLYQHMDLSGSAMTTLFDAPISVKDSFFVAFNLFDYAHGGYDGDTIGLLCSPDGSRTSNATLDRGRNVLQFHSHASVAWRDYATQNFTPADKDMVHFALYPIVEFESVTSIKDEFAGVNGLKIRPPYPNPSSGTITIGFYLASSSRVVIDIIDLRGKLLKHLEKGLLSSGESSDIVDLSEFNHGNYIYIVKTDNGSLAGKFSVYR